MLSPDAAQAIRESGGVPYSEYLLEVSGVRKAFPAKAESAPHWKWAVELSRELGRDLAVSSSRDVFKALGAAVPELASFDWDASAPANKKGPGINPLPASADGRPPGYREQGVPRVRGI